MYKHEITLKIREKMNQIQRNNENKIKIIIAWIPGHKNIQGNEDADEIAKEATKESMDTRIKVPLGDWKGVNKEKEWNRTLELVERIEHLKGKNTSIICFKGKERNRGSTNKKRREV